MNENQFGVILETLLDKIDGIAEGQRLIEGRLDNIEGQLNELKADVKSVKQDNQIIKTHLAAIEDGLNNHEKRITTIEEKVAI